MKTSRLIVSALALALASTGLAGTQMPASCCAAPAGGDSGFFIGAKGGFFWLQNESASQGSIGADIHFKTGWGITVPVGYDFGNGLSLAFTAGFYEAGIDTVDVHSGTRHGSFSASGNVQLVPLMANAAYNVKLVDNLHWYLGAGLGTVHSKDTLDSFGGIRVGYSDSSWRFGFQAFTGLRYDVCKTSSIYLGYRYINVDRSGDNHGGHSLEAGLNWRF